VEEVTSFTPAAVLEVDMSQVAFVVVMEATVAVMAEAPDITVEATTATTEAAPEIMVVTAAMEATAIGPTTVVGVGVSD
jgi:hypothetical protein